MSLHHTRIAAARAELSDYTFDEGLEPVEVGGWEFELYNDRAVCALFFPQPEDSDKGQTVLGQFTVEFEPSTADITGAYASIKGEDTGFRADGRGGPKFRH